MRSKSILLLALALGCGLVASIGISQVMERRSAGTGTADTEPVFVALTDVQVGDLLTPQNVKLEEWPKSKIRPDMLTKLEQIDNKRCKIKLYAGEPLLSGKVVGPDEVDKAAYSIPKGYRVIPVRVDAVSNGASLIQPRDRVDLLVYVSKNAAHSVAETSTRTVLQDVQVFAVDNVYKPENGEQVVAAKTISLLVTPKQAEKVALASEIGNIRLIMRSPDDSVITDSDGTDTSSIFGGIDSASSAGSPREPVAPAAVEPTAEKPKDAGFAKWIGEKLKEEDKTVAPPQAPADPPPSTFKMVVIEGSEVREVEVNKNGGIVTGAKPTTKSAAEPELAPQEAQPAAEAIQDESQQRKVSQRRRAIRS